SGADVALVARSGDALDELSREIAGFGARAVPLRCDVTDSGQVEAAVAAALEQLGRIDVLVNNAGGPLFNAPFLEIRDEGWRKAIDLNLTSVVSFCRTVGAGM